MALKRELGEFDPRDTALYRWLMVLSYVGERCFSPRRRAWLYRVLLAVTPVLGAYGLVTDHLAMLWVVLAAAVLGQGVAVAHAPRTSRRDA